MEVVVTQGNLKGQRGEIVNFSIKGRSNAFVVVCMESGVFKTLPLSHVVKKGSRACVKFDKEKT